MSGKLTSPNKKKKHIPLEGNNLIIWKSVGVVDYRYEFEKYHSSLKSFTLSNAKHGRKYWNRSRGKLAFNGSSGKDYGTDGLN